MACSTKVLVRQGYQSKLGGGGRSNNNAPSAAPPPFKAKVPKTCDSWQWCRAPAAYKLHVCKRLLRTHALVLLSGRACRACRRFPASATRMPHAAAGPQAKVSDARGSTGGGGGSLRAQWQQAQPCSAEGALAPSPPPPNTHRGSQASTTKPKRQKNGCIHLYPRDWQYCRTSAAPGADNDARSRRRNSLTKKPARMRLTPRTPER